MASNNSSSAITANLTSCKQPTMEPPYEDCMTDSTVKNIVVTLFIIIIILSVLLNVLLWLIFILYREVRSIPTLSMISLSLSDFITSTTLGSMEVYYVWNYPHWSFGEFGTNLLNSFWCLSLVTPFMHISVMTHDRYKAVLSLINYKTTRKWSHEIFKLSLIWLYSVLVVLLMRYHFTQAPDDAYSWNVLPVWYYSFLAVHIAIPLVLCTVLYLQIIKSVNKQRKELARLQASLSTEVNYAKSIAIIIVGLYAVWLPVIGMEIIYAIRAYTCTVGLLGVFSVLLTCTSGVINPIVFLSKHRLYQKAIASFFCMKTKLDNRASTYTTSTTEMSAKPERKQTVCSTVNEAYAQ